LRESEWATEHLSAECGDNGDAATGRFAQSANRPGDGRQILKSRVSMIGEFIDRTVTASS
jgi:hypothetical protein